MDLTDYEQKYAKYGERHSTYNWFWNGFEWQEDQPAWDFKLKRDWLVLVVCGCMVIGGLLLISNLN